MRTLSELRDHARATLAGAVPEQVERRFIDHGGRGAGSFGVACARVVGFSPAGDQYGEGRILRCRWVSDAGAETGDEFTVYAITTPPGEDLRVCGPNFTLGASVPVYYARMWMVAWAKWISGWFIVGAVQGFRHCPEEPPP